MTEFEDASAENRRELLAHLEGRTVRRRPEWGALLFAAAIIGLQVWSWIR